MPSASSIIIAVSTTTASDFIYERTGVRRNRQLIYQDALKSSAVRSLGIVLLRQVRAHRRTICFLDIRGLPKYMRWLGFAKDKCYPVTRDEIASFGGTIISREDCTMPDATVHRDHRRRFVPGQGLNIPTAPDLSDAITVRRTIGRRISTFRMNAGLSLSELGRRLGVSRQRALQIEYGSGFQRIQEIAAILDVPAFALASAEELSAISTGRGPGRPRSTSPVLHHAQR